MIKLIIPYIGKVELNHIVALNQLATCDYVQVNFITNFRELKNKKTISSKVNIFDIEDVFLHDNLLGIKLSGLLSNPYKFCDLKPFYNVIFDIKTDDFWGFSDLDCIFNSMILSKKFEDIVKGEEVDRVYGDRGHLMVFGKKSSIWCQESLLEVINKFSSKNIELLDLDTNYALDEFKFLHKILNNHHSVDVFWEADFFYPIMDIDYKCLNPRNLNFDVDIKFNNKGILLGEEYYKGSYFHLQKRNIEVDFPHIDKDIYLNLDVSNGSFIYSSSPKPIEKSSFFSKIMYYCRVFIRRAKTRFSNHGFKVRPSL